MYKILYVHPSNELYGADRSLLRLVRGLDRSQFEPFVVVPNDIAYEGLLTDVLTAEGIAQEAISLGVLRRQYQTPRGALVVGGRTLRSALWLARRVRQAGIDLVHTNSTAVIAGGLAARLAGVPHIWHVREIITTPAWLNRGVAQALSMLSDRVIAVSQPVRDHLVAAQPSLAGRTCVIHNGIDPAPFLATSAEERRSLRQAWGIDPEAVVVGTVGRISSWKGQVFLVDVMSEVLRRCPTVKLAIVGGDVPGGGERAQLVEHVHALGIGASVQIHGFSTRIAQSLAAFDLFVLPSIRPDPFPTVVLEAMAAGLPVVATAHGGPLEQVVHGRTGFLVSPDETGPMTDALLALIGSRELRGALGAAGRSRLLERFSVESHLAAVEAVYGELLS